MSESGEKNPKKALELDLSQETKSIESDRSYRAFSGEEEIWDFESGSTRVDNEDALAEESTTILDDGELRFCLAVEQGQELNREFILHEGVTTVGRGIENDVILTDVSISRHHLEIHRDGDNFLLKDLGSGNGTYLNDRKAHEQLLRPGDRIRLGQTVLIFREELKKDLMVKAETQRSEAPLSLRSTQPPPLDRGAGDLPQAQYAVPISGRNADEPSRTQTAYGNRDPNTALVIFPKRWLLVFAACASALILILAVVLIYLLANDSKQDSVQQNFDAGVLAFDSGDLKQAERRFSQVLLRRPQHEPTLEYMRKIAKLRKTTTQANTHINAAIDLYRRGQFEYAAQSARAEALKATTEQREQLSQLALDIAEFGVLIKQVERSAEKPFLKKRAAQKALEIDRRIGGYHSKKLQQALQQALLQVAEKEWNTGSFDVACKAGAEAFSYGVRSQLIVEIVGECQARAVELADKANKLQESQPDKAKRIYHEALGLLPEKDALRPEIEAALRKF